MLFTRSALAALALVLSQVSADSIIGPGVSHQLAIHRAAAVRDVRYALRLDVTARDTAVGHVDIDFAWRGREPLVLDFRGPRIAHLRVNGAAMDLVPRDGHLVIPASALHAGTNAVGLDFRALIAPAGTSSV
jgi:aminopeptidase N